MEKEELMKAPVMNVQYNIDTQINIGRVEGNYYQHVETLNIGTLHSEKEPHKEYVLESLFGSGERNRKEAEKFCAFLKKQGWADTTLNSAMANPVNKAFVALYRNRMEKDVLPEQPNGDACYRFLKDDCRLTFTVGQKTYANFIRKAIDTMSDRDLGDMPELVRRGI